MRYTRPVCKTPVSARIGIPTNWSHEDNFVISNSTTRYLTEFRAAPLIAVQCKERDYHQRDSLMTEGCLTGWFTLIFRRFGNTAARKEEVKSDSIQKIKLRTRMTLGSYYKLCFQGRRQDQVATHKHTPSGASFSLNPCGLARVTVFKPGDVYWLYF